MIFPVYPLFPLKYISAQGKLVSSVLGPQKATAVLHSKLCNAILTSVLNKGMQGAGRRVLQFGGNIAGYKEILQWDTVMTSGPDWHIAIALLLASNSLKYD